MIELCDVTLREGLQAPGAILTTDNKLELAHMLDQTGISQIQISLPGLDKERLEETRIICAERYQAKTEIMTNGSRADWRENILAACGCNSDIVHSFIDSKRACLSNESIARAQKRINDVCTLIHSQNKICNISFVGAIDVALDRLMTLVVYAAEKADRIRVADTYGVVYPEKVELLVSKLSRACRAGNTKLGIHLHNDLGLALANMLAATKAGIDFIDVSINGLGSRAGNVALAEAAYVLKYVCNEDTGIYLEKMVELSRRAAELTGVSVSRSAPLVGENVFDEEIDIHAVEILTKAPKRGIIPELVGGKQHVLYGALTTPEVIQLTAKNRGKAIPVQVCRKIQKVLKAYNLTHRGTVLYEDDFWNIVTDVQGVFR